MDKESLRCHAYCLELINNGRLSLRVNRGQAEEFLFSYDASENAVRFGPINQGDKVFYHSHYLGGKNIITFHVADEGDGEIILPRWKKELQYYQIEHVSDLDNLETRHLERLDRRESWADTDIAVSIYNSLVRSLGDEGF